MNKERDDLAWSDDRRQLLVMVCHYVGRNFRLAAQCATEDYAQQQETGLHCVLLPGISATI
jgi:hypothetical protein